MNNRGKVLTALAAGLAAGGILGILFAPGKGSETRRKIKEQGKKVADEIEHKFCKAKEKFNDLKDDMEEIIKEKTKGFD